MLPLIHQQNIHNYFFSNIIDSLFHFIKNKNNKNYKSFFNSGNAFFNFVNINESFKILANYIGVYSSLVALGIISIS